MCEKRTITLRYSGGTFSRVAELAGAVVDIDTRGSLAWAIFDAPAEIRLLDVTDPAQPLLRATRAAEGNPVAIAASPAAGIVATLGQKLYVYSSDLATRHGELLDSFVDDPLDGIDYIDQEVLIEGGCALVTGRSAQPQLFSIRSASQWDPVPAPSVPSAVRDAFAANGMIYLLTEHSVEVWSSVPPPDVRRRPAR